MNISEAGLGFITVHEGLVLHVYDDSQNLCTIGVGHLINPNGPCTTADEIAWANFTYADALRLLNEDLQWAQDCVNANVTVALNQNQFDALVSFCFNLGCPQFTSSTALRRLNTGDYVGCTEAMKWWNNGGELDSRRYDEVMLFNTPVASSPAGGVVAIDKNRWWAVTIPNTDPTTGAIISDNDFIMVRDTIHLKRGVIITNPAFAQAARLPYVIYVGRADVPSQPWRFHRRVMQLTGAGTEETKAMLQDIVDRGLPKLPV